MLVGRIGVADLLRQLRGQLAHLLDELLQVDVMFVGIVTIGILGLITSALFQEIERKAVPWKTE